MRLPVIPRPSLGPDLRPRAEFSAEVAVSPPSTVRPGSSAPWLSCLTTTGAAIAWTTNEPADYAGGVRSHDLAYGSSTPWTPSRAPPTRRRSSVLLRARRSTIAWSRGRCGEPRARNRRIRPSPPWGGPPAGTPGTHGKAQSEVYWKFSATDATVARTRPETVWTARSSTDGPSYVPVAGNYRGGAGPSTVSTTTSMSPQTRPSNTFPSRLRPGS